MTTIPLSHAPDNVGYKLLELPPELVALIEGEDAPAFLTLTPSPTTALLKTPTRTYSLRQKNTSNGLILLRSAAANPAQQRTTADTADSSGGGCLQAFATLHETIELIPLEAGQDVPAARARGKWHEKFGRTR